eukprot:Rhum_TRINITY_DN15332_c11_g1::Rhum_TRINITY_DN15332_c11_g1_i1::g.151829::m.151829
MREVGSDKGVEGRHGGTGRHRNGSWLGQHNKMHAHVVCAQARLGQILSKTSVAQTLRRLQRSGSVCQGVFHERRNLVVRHAVPDAVARLHEEQVGAAALVHGHVRERGDRLSVRRHAARLLEVEVAQRTRHGQQPLDTALRHPAARLLDALLLSGAVGLVVVGKPLGAAALADHDDAAVARVADDVQRGCEEQHVGGAALGPALLRVDVGLHVVVGSEEGLHDARLDALQGAGRRQRLRREVDGAAEVVSEVRGQLLADVRGDAPAAVPVEDSSHGDVGVRADLGYDAVRVLVAAAPALHRRGGDDGGVGEHGGVGGLVGHGDVEEAALCGEDEFEDVVEPLDIFDGAEGAFSVVPKALLVHADVVAQRNVVIGVGGVVLLRGLRRKALPALQKDAVCRAPPRCHALVEDLVEVEGVESALERSNLKFATIALRRMCVVALLDRHVRRCSQGSVRTLPNLPCARTVRRR